MEIIIGIGVGVAVIVAAGTIGFVGRWFVQEKLGWFRPRQEPAVDERIRQEVTRQLDELQAGSAAPPIGAPRVETDALAAQATKRTESLLAEAVELQRQHKEREAIERFLTAYEKDMPPGAKADLHILAGSGFLRVSELEEAEGHYRQALAAKEQAGDREGQAAALGGLGLVYTDRGDLDNAENHHQLALAMSEEIGNKLGQATSLGNLGNVYHLRGDLDKAETHHNRALAIAEEVGYRLGQACDLGNLGSVYGDRGDLDKAEEYHSRALALDDEIGNRRGQAQDLANLATVYGRRGDLDGAVEHFKRAAVIFERISDRLGQAQALANLGTT